MTNTDVTAKLNSLKTQIDQGKTEKTRAETNLQNYTKQRDEIVEEMKALGVTPETVDQEIERLDKEIEAGLQQAERLLAG